MLVPGTVLLAGAGALWPGTNLASLLIPSTTGAALIHLVGAYAVGHVLQAIGNLAERWYWKPWGGMPTDWAFTRPRRGVFGKAVADCKQATEHSGEITDLNVWRQVLSSARAKVYSSGLAARVGVFNGSYGMFRGLCVAGLVFLASAWTSEQLATLRLMTTIYAVLLALTSLSLYRMHHFGLLYARELHANIAIVAKREQQVGD